MGYAGYVPAKLPPSQLSDLQAALKAVGSLESLEVVGKLTYNSAVQPKEDKFRRVRLTNAKIAKLVLETPGVLEAMTALGWEKEGEEFLVLPSAKNANMGQFRDIESAKENLVRELRKA